MSVRAALAHAAEFLQARGVEAPLVDAEHLLGHVLGLSRTALYADAARKLSPDERRRFDELVGRRAGREPLAYVLGEWGFRRLMLRLDRRALIPRPETEVLVQRCLALLAGVERPRVLDVGVGSGAVALAIADEHRGARVTGVDVSQQALDLARENAERSGLEIDLRLGGFEDAAAEWDLVVSNPPYVAPADYETLQPEILDWEPRTALVGEGMHVELARRVRRGMLALECGDGQAPQVAAALEELGYRDVTITPDLTGRDRVVDGRRA